MKKTIIAGASALIIFMAMLCMGAIAFLFGGGDSACTSGSGPAPSTAPSLNTPSSIDASNTTWDTEQLHNAATIISVGLDMGVPVRGWIIALAAAMQESHLVNLPNLGDANNADSLGLFQERPSQGWGTPDQITDPVYAATKFYQHLLAVTGWQTMTIAQAAQAVEVSAFPSRYSTWETDAAQLVTTVGSANPRAIPEDLEQCVSTCPTASDSAGVSDPTLLCLDSAAVLARAATWLTAWDGGPVPYLSSDDPATLLAGYRRDCSGYASMALGLPGPGLTTTELAEQATPIPKSALGPGDLLINPAPDLAGHVVIFGHWTDATMTSYVGYEQSGDAGTHLRVIPYPYFGDYLMGPYRWVN